MHNFLGPSFLGSLCNRPNWHVLWRESLRKRSILIIVPPRTVGETKEQGWRPESNPRQICWGVQRSQKHDNSAISFLLWGDQSCLWHLVYKQGGKWRKRVIWKTTNGIWRILSVGTVIVGSGKTSFSPRWFLFLSWMFSSISCRHS